MMNGTKNVLSREHTRKLICRRDWDALKEYNLKDMAFKYQDFFGADLSGVDFSGSAFDYATFNFVNLSHAILRGALFYYTSLLGADLTGADLRGADLYYADLRGAKLHGTITDESTKWFTQQCPEEGEFIGYKKVFGTGNHEYIAKLRIPESALRCSATTEKCRCSEAEVMSLTNPDGGDAGVKTAYSWFNPDFHYTVGEMVRAEDFCPDRWEACAPGIHFFMDRETAVKHY